MVNKSISGKDKVLSLIDLKEISQFYSTRILEIKNSKLAINGDLKEIQKQVQRIQNQLNEMNAKTTKSVHQVQLAISSKTKQEIDLVLKYYVYEAGWSPYYDIRVKDISKPIEFNHKANVWQNTGIEWKDVNLTISTRNPTIAGTLPFINTVYLDFIDAHTSRGNYVGTNTVSREGLQGLVNLNAGVFNTGEGFIVRGARDKESQIRVDDTDVGNEFTGGFGSGSRDLNPMASSYSAKEVQVITGGFSAEYGNARGNFLSVEFKTDIPYTIPTDAKPHLVDMKTSEIPGIFEYYTAPKFQMESYLVAKISDWENISLLPGPANVYFENSFTGKTELQPNIAGDTLDLSLGVDKNIVVTRDIIKDFTETKFLSSDIERFFAYKITVKTVSYTHLTLPTIYSV